MHSTGYSVYSKYLKEEPVTSKDRSIELSQTETQREIKQ